MATPRKKAIKVGTRPHKKGVPSSAVQRQRDENTASIVTHENTIRQDAKLLKEIADRNLRRIGRMYAQTEAFLMNGPEQGVSDVFNGQAEIESEGGPEYLLFATKQLHKTASFMENICENCQDITHADDHFPGLIAAR